jgi:hypothetical protein
MLRPFPVHRFIVSSAFSSRCTSHVYKVALLSKGLSAAIQASLLLQLAILLRLVLVTLRSILLAFIQ